MTSALLVGVGGFIGAMLRYAVNFVAASWTQFPVSTIVVNSVGCAAAGILLALADSRPGLSEPARLFLMTGFLGGFTTFSAFGAETIVLVRQGEYGAAVLYAALNVLLGLGLTFLGWFAARSLLISKV